ncbi:MAG: 1,4-beta-N-acetylmuramidase, partial [Ruminococcus sp.]|nr:1,4-beta-N-acetylmuramidase [Ruminococcus sp.]
GIDVSFYQGDIDFSAVKESGFSFVIIKAGGTGFGVDSKFEQYYSDAQAAGLDIGCYYYTYSSTVDGIKSDAQELLEIIKGKTFNYPVFLDFEEEVFQSADMIGTNTDIINTFCTAIKRSGYYPGVYTSSSLYKNYIDSTTLGNSWDFWVASYGDHTFESDEYKYDFSMWQYSNAGIVNGIKADVDLNVVYVDYPSLILEFKDKILKYTS